MHKFSMRQLLHAQAAYQFNWLQWCIWSLSKETAGVLATYNKQTTYNRQIIEFSDVTDLSQLKDLQTKHSIYILGQLIL